MTFKFTKHCISIVIWIALSFYMSCSSSDEPGPVDCSATDLAISATSTNPTACGTNNGSITATATGGKAPYEFSLNGGTFQSSGSFTGLSAGSYDITVKDANECTRLNATSITAPNSTLAATVSTTQDNQCLTDNGSITVNATGGAGSYQYRIGTGAFGTSNVFNNIKFGQHSITVQDASNCQVVIAATVARGATGISYNSTIKQIIDTRCALPSCHVSGQQRDFTSFSNVQSSASNIKIRTSGRSMPPSGSTPLTQAEIDQIACWVDDGALNN